MNDRAYIYGLRGDDCVVRYVGKADAPKLRFYLHLDHGDFAEAVNTVAGAMMYFNITMQAPNGQWLDEWLASAHSHISGGETIAQLVDAWNDVVKQAK